jgi:transcriptional regulator with XRE-family HTH domain
VTPSTKSLPARLRAARKVAGLTQEAVAAVLGVQGPRIAEWEAGKHTPGPERLARLAEIYGVLPEDLRTDAEADAGVPTVAIPLHQLTYWRGVIETEHKHLGGAIRSLGALQESLSAMRETLDRATSGIGGFIASGVLPTAETTPPPDPNGRPSMREELAARYARRDAERAAAEAAKQAAERPAKTVNGRGGDRAG